MDRIKSWPGSIIDQHSLIESIGKFLRTHKDGDQRLMDWLESVPPDRTEEEYRQLQQDAADENEAHIQKKLAEVNSDRAARGKPPIDRQGNVIRR